MTRGRGGRARGADTETSFGLWWLFWAAVGVGVVALFALGLAAPRRPGDGAGVGLAMAALASAMLVLWAVGVRLVFWGIGRVAQAPLRHALYVAVPVVFLLAREGALGERAAGWCGLELQAGGMEGTRSARSTTTRVVGGQASVVPGCSVAPVASGSASGRGFAAALAPGCTARPGAPVELRYVLEASDAWCYLPLYKQASWPYRVRIEITGALAASSVVEGRVEQHAYGLESCRSFNEKLGRAAAEAAREEAERLVARLRDESRARDAEASRPTLKPPPKRRRSANR